MKNHYKLFVFPKRTACVGDGLIFETLDADATARLQEGKAVLLMPDITKIEQSIEGFYCQDFWCYPMFKTISNMMNKPEPIGTMGLLIENNHPALAHFKTESYSEPQWWEIVSHSRSEIIDDCAEGKEVIVRTIDNFERNHNLALLYEYEKDGGKVVVCNADYEKLMLSPEGRQFMYSLVEYVKGEK